MLSRVAVLVPVEVRVQIECCHARICPSPSRTADLTLLNVPRPSRASLLDPRYDTCRWSVVCRKENGNMLFWLFGALRLCVWLPHWPHECLLLSVADLCILWWVDDSPGLLLVFLGCLVTQRLLPARPLSGNRCARCYTCLRTSAFAFSCLRMSSCPELPVIAFINRSHSVSSWSSSHSLTSLGSCIDRHSQICLSV